MNSQVVIGKKGTKEWLPFFSNSVPRRHAEWAKERIERNYSTIEAKIVPWEEALSESSRETQVQ